MMNSFIICKFLILLFSTHIIILEIYSTWKYVIHPENQATDLV